MSNLADKQCVPCRGGVPPLTHAEIQPLLAQVDGWRVEGDKRLIKKFEFKDFMGPIGFANKIAEIAKSRSSPGSCGGVGKVEVTI